MLHHLLFFILQFEKKQGYKNNTFFINKQIIFIFFVNFYSLIFLIKKIKNNKNNITI